MKKADVPADVPDLCCFPHLLAETSSQGGHLATCALTATLPNQTFCVQLMLLRHHPCSPGNAGWKHTTAWAMVLLLCGWEQNDEPLYLEGLTRHRRYLSTLHLCTKQHDCCLSCRLCSHLFPKGRSKCNKVLLLLFSLPFKRCTVFAGPLCKGRQCKAGCPALLWGVGMFGGVFELGGARFIVQAKGREGCWAQLHVGGAQPFPHTSSVEIFANNNNYNTKENE